MFQHMVNVEIRCAQCGAVLPMVLIPKPKFDRGVWYVECYPCPKGCHPVQETSPDTTQRSKKGKAL